LKKWAGSTSGNQNGTRMLLNNQSAAISPVTRFPIQYAFPAQV
jgi:hypothetical protein